jgi:hypothetical protein
MPLMDKVLIPFRPDSRSTRCWWGSDGLLGAALVSLAAGLGQTYILALASGRII